MELPIRPRRNRRNAAIRTMIRETELRVENLVLPLFVCPGEDRREPIASMPGQFRQSLNVLVDLVGEATELGIQAIALFPAIPEKQKSPDAAAALDPRGLIPRALRTLKERFPDLLLISDIALDPFNSDGHDGLVDSRGRIVNDTTVDVLAKMAVLHAQAGADFVAPSDMMDGRVAAIRRALDQNGLEEAGILSYAVKYASAFYGPFRDALQSAPKSGDKKTYQMDPANIREALREATTDTHEGADILMVKPAGPYLDVVRAVAEISAIPVAAYQVSGEYAMLVAAAENGWIDREACILESLLGIRRAGAQLIFTYFAMEAALYLHKRSTLR